MIKKFYKTFVSYAELMLAVVVFVALAAFTYFALTNLVYLDWALSETFYNFISVILLILVGLELMRLMISHSLTTVLELMILIIARKMLSPEIDAQSILLLMLAMAVVVGLTYLYTLKPIKQLDDLSS